MIKVSILKDSVQTHGATFQTQSEADAWIDEGTRQEWWGKAAYTETIPAVTEMQEVVVQEQIIEQQVVVITPAELDAEGNVITPEVTELQDVIVQPEIREMQEVVITPETTIEHPAEFTVVIEDISAQVAQQQALAKRKEKRAFGESMIDQISLVNETAQVNETTLEALVLDSDFMVIREHLYSGSLLSAYNKILATEVKILTVFSQAALDELKSKLQVKLQELGEL